MKKLVAVLMICLMMTAFGLAESNYKNLNDEELLELRDSITDELFERGVEFETDFYAGVYVVGKDIRAGTYDILFDEVDKWGCVFINIYETEEAYESRDRKLHEIINELTKGYRVELNEGMVFVIDLNGSAVMRIRNEKPAWMP